MPSETLTCALGIGADTLSAWRDGLLPNEEAERLRGHVAECAVCERRLAEFAEVARVLRAQRELEPGDCIIDSVRTRLGQPHGHDWRRWMPPGRRDLWSGLGALGAVAAVLLLFVAVLAGGPRGQLTGKATPATTATATPAQAPAFSPTAGVNAAWGAQGTTATVNTQIDDTHTFEAHAIMPDGATLIGYERSRGSGAQLWDITAVGLFDVATKRFTAMIIPVDPNFPPGCRLTDGRFVIVQDSDQPGAAGAIFHSRFWAYDRATGQVWLVATGSQYHGILNAYLSHGLLVFDTNDGTIQVADLAARTITPLLLPPLGASVLAFNWPYVVYLRNDSAASPSPDVVHDLRTNRDVTLAALARLPQSADTTGMALAGDTLFFTTTPVNGSATTLYQLDHMLSPDAAAQPIAILPAAALGGLVSADDRIVFFAGAAWDRMQRRFVINESNTGGGGAGMWLAGNVLAVAVPADTPGHPYVEQVTIYDTTRLPVRT